MRLMIRDLSPDQDYAVQYRLRDQTGAAGNWSQIYSVHAQGDTVPPAPVTGLTWVSSGSSFIAKWTAPTLDANGFELRDLNDYQVVVSAGIISKTYYVSTTTFEFTVQMNGELFTDLASSLTVTVKARDNTGNLSTSATATTSASTPPVPSAPTVSVYLGQVTVAWDGTVASGFINSLNTEYVEVHASTTTGFTTSSSTLKERFIGLFPGKQATVLSGFAYGTPVYVRLVAVNRLGVKGTASAQATATPSRISGLDISDGQISTAQINFTAKDIGGANAYYVTTTTARDALTGVKNGDIAYITGSGYATYRYNGTTWVSATEIGVVAGTKILAGTLTSDAVGTNLLITSSANIGTAVIDSANIASLNAAKITAGVLQSSATVTFGGGSRPAWSLDLAGNANLNNVLVRGELVIGLSTDSSAIKTASVVKSYDYSAGSAGWAIKGDGSVEFNNGTFRGAVSGATITSGSIIGTTYATASSGRRIEIGTSGDVGSIKFIAPDGTVTEIKSFTATGSTENTRFGIPIASTWEYWNSFAVSEVEQAVMYSKTVAIGFAGGTAVSGGAYNIYFVSDKTNGTGFLRQTIDENDYKMWFAPSGVWQVSEVLTSVTGTSTVARATFETGSSGWNRFYNRETGGTVFYDINASGVSHDRLWYDNDTFNFKWPDGGAYRIAFTRGQDAGDEGARVALYNRFGYGVSIFMAATSTGTNPRVEFKDVTGAVYFPIWGGAYTNQSTAQSKVDIQDWSDSSYEKLNSLRIRQFRRKGLPDENGAQNSVNAPQLGLIAEEAPEEVLTRDSDGNIVGVTYDGQLAILISSTQKLVAEVESLRGEIEILKRSKA